MAMGLARSNSAPLRIRRKASAWTSVAACAALLLLWVVAATVGYASEYEDVLELRGDPGKTPGTATTPSSTNPGRRLDSGSVPLDDLIIDKPYRSSTNRGWVFLHIIGIGYMLLGLNTVCDVYFTGSLEVMVEKWKIKPDVAGATFMAAGGSAPELCTSLIGTLVVKNDVGFGTIVGSAVFNVLFVIGLCGFLSSGEIKLTWWPLFRDCTYYLLGLGLLAIFASDEKIVLWEALVLFGAYLLYCILMYNNTKLEALTDIEFQRAKRASDDSSGGNISFNPVHPQCTGPDGCPMQKKVIGAWEAPSDKMPTHGSFDLSESVGTPDNSMIGETGQSTTHGQQQQNSKTDTVVADLRISEARAHSERTSTWPSRAQTRSGSGVQVSGKMRGSYIMGHVVAERHEMRMASLGSHNTHNTGSQAHDTSGQSKGSSSSAAESNCGKTHPEAHQPCVREEEEDLECSRDAKELETPGRSAGSQDPQGAGGGAPQAEQQEEAEKEGEEDDDDGDLMTRPEGGLSLVLWFLSLPIYVPLHFTTVQPSERWFLVTFAQSLLWIAGFNFLLVWWVEILGEVCHIHYIVMSFTLLAAGTSIPDLVSSVAVARMGEGDMAISSSIGSNIFDILVGLPLPWIIQTGIVEGGSTVKIISPFLTFHVLLLLFMVLAVILSIHCMGWKLNKTLGLMMAFLYAVFLSVAITIEVVDPPPTALMF